MCRRILINIGIRSKLRPFLSVKLLQRNLSLRIMKKVQIKQNLVARLIFFVNTQGKHIESALPLLNLLDIILTVYNVYYLHALKFTHLCHKGLLPDICRDTFHYAQ